MTISLTSKKAIIALGMVAPMMLVACGSPDDDSGDPTSAEQSTTTSAATSTESTEVTSSASSVEETTSPEEATEPEPAPATDTVAPLSDPFAASQMSTEASEPVAGGAPASVEDRAEIEQLLGGLYETRTLHQFIRYVPENACNSVIDANGGEAALDLAGIPDMQLNQMPSYREANAHIQSIENVEVEGHNASATVTAVSSGQAETENQRFLHEDGRWKFCN